MNHIIYLIALFANIIFFSFTALFNINYESGSSNLYSTYCIICFSISILFFIRDFIPQKKRNINILSLFVILVYIFLGFLSGYSSDRSLLCLVAFSFPATCIAIYYSNSKSIFSMVKWLDVLFVFLTISLLFLSNRLYLGGDDYSQSLSYYTAMCFLIDIFLLKYGKLYDRFRIFNNSFIRFLYYLLLPFYILLIFFSGGRGGFVAVCIGLFVMLFLSRRDISKKLFLLFFIFISVLFVMDWLLQSQLQGHQDMFLRNYERVFSYVSAEGIDMTHTANRDVVYSKSWELIMQAPILGYGMFAYKDVFIPTVGFAYPHNIFLEWLLQGGLILFFLYSGVTLVFFRKLHFLIKKDNRYAILLPFIVFPFTQLLFSNSYMESPLFWFSVIYVLNSNSKKSLVQ